MTGPYHLHTKIKVDYLAGVAVSLAPLAYFFNALRAGLVLSPDDGVIFNIPLRVVSAMIIRDGYLPLWNPYIFCGLPLHGASQAGLLFPLNWFYLVFTPATATNLMMLTTYAVTGLGAYLFARRSGSDVAGSIATSLIWQWGAFQIEQIGHTNIVQTAALLPWVLWSVEGYVASGERRRGVVLAALIAVQAFAGHQQTFTYSLLLTCAYAFVLTRSARKRRESYLLLTVLIIAGVALAAVQILPSYELLRNSLRASASYEFFTSFSMPRRFVLTLFAPYVLGGGNGLLFKAPYIGAPFFGEYLAYVGILTIMLAAVAVFLKRDVRTMFWAIVFVVALLLAIGGFLPLGAYRLVHHVPLLNLFRSPARHLMEVEFALAVLAGMGLTAIRRSKQTVVWIPTMIVGSTVFLSVCFTVTWWRPAAFRLAREAPVSVLRAPELFIPIVVAALSLGALLLFARHRCGRALVGFFVVLILDLLLYGYGSGWHTHAPGRDNVLWGEPATVKFLRSRKPGDQSTYRILSQEQALDPNSPASPANVQADWSFLLQPDIYMTHGIQNAAGYDGFGLSRYSRLAGDMKVWGELTNPERTLSTQSRELDLLNIRYLLAHSTKKVVLTAPLAFPKAPIIFQGAHFGENDLNIPGIVAGQCLAFHVPPTTVDHIALLTNLAWSTDLPDGTVVGYIRLRSEQGQTFEFELRAGEHSSEWAYDRLDIKSKIKHRRAPVATSYAVQGPQGDYEGHTYVSIFRLPAKAKIVSGSITVPRVTKAPELMLGVTRVTLADGENAYPLSTGSITKEAAEELIANEQGLAPHWQKLTELNEVAIFENTRMLPRAWLTNQVQVLSEGDILQAIRTGKLPNGQVWEPRQVALVESGLDFESKPGDESRTAEITNYEPNRVRITTTSPKSAVLVLSDNHYPGWLARVDGREVETLRVDYNLRGVVLAPGQHQVEFVYRPKSVLLGLAVSLVTLMCLMLWWKRQSTNKS